VAVAGLQLTVEADREGARSGPSRSLHRPSARSRCCGLQLAVGPPDRTAPGRNLTPVMARLDPRDVEVLDALITVGIVPNRAEGVRWALARIRERPAYTQLRQHIGKLDELKAQL
jgi:hypothetical protein